MVFISCLLYGSADLYIHYGNPDNYLCKIFHLSLAMKTFVCWGFLLAALVIVFILLKFKYALSLIEPIQLIFLPWAFHSIAPLFSNQDNPEKRILIYINLVPIRYFIINSAFALCLQEFI